MKHQTGYAIQQLRTKNLVKGVESLSAFVAAVVANMLIPQLLLKYIYDPTTLVAAPPVFEYLPLVTYTLALLYFVAAMIGTFRRERQAGKMEIEMNLSAGNCCSDSSCCSDEDDISEEELKELERIVDEALKPTKKTTKAAKKKTTVKSKKTAVKKKSTRKTTKK